MMHLRRAVEAAELQVATGLHLQLLCPLKHLVFFSLCLHVNFISGIVPAQAIMSTASKVTLLSTVLATGGIVAFVHWAQSAEKVVRMSASVLVHSRSPIIEIPSY